MKLQLLISLLFLALIVGMAGGISCTDDREDSSPFAGQKDDEQGETTSIGSSRHRDRDDHDDDRDDDHDDDDDDNGEAGMVYVVFEYAGKGGDWHGVDDVEVWDEAGKVLNEPFAKDDIPKGWKILSTVRGKTWKILDGHDGGAGVHSSRYAAQVKGQNRDQQDEILRTPHLDRAGDGTGAYHLSFWNAGRVDRANLATLHVLYTCDNGATMVPLYDFPGQGENSSYTYYQEEFDFDCDASDDDDVTDDDDIVDDDDDVIDDDDDVVDDDDDVVVDDDDDATGDPAESCLDPYILLPGDVLDFDSTAAVDDYFGHCGGAGGLDLVFQFDAIQGRYYFVDVDGAFDTLLYLRSGDCESGREIDCNDDSGAATHSRIEFLAQQSGPVFAFADSADQSGGAFSISLDECAGCYIGGVCYDDGQANPDNACQACDVSVSSAAWSDNDGQSCNDGEFCNGADSCLAGACSVHDGDPCPDDGLFCNGSEFCDEASDSCGHQGAPSCPDDGLFCNGTEVCDEASDSCGHQGTPSCASDGLFCNGTEYCDEGADQCASSGDPCSGGAQCDEASDSCQQPATPPSYSTTHSASWDCYICHATSWRGAPREPHGSTFTAPTQCSMCHQQGTQDGSYPGSTPPGFHQPSYDCFSCHGNPKHGKTFQDKSQCLACHEVN